jgi:pyruvate carboxylase
VFFEANGVPRMVEVVDRRQSAAAEGGGGVAAKPAREKADPVVLGSVGCPMSGQVIEVVAKPGEWASSPL